MKEYFTIGEISSTLGLSSHTLRYYDKIGLLQPAYINRETGYRFYAYHQLFTLERIRHLQHIGFNLDDIQQIIADPTMNTFQEFLDRKKRELDEEINHLSILRSTVENYQRYYRHSNDSILFKIPFKANFETRYLFAEAYRSGEPLFGTAGYRLMVRKSEADCKNLNFLRQIGFLLDYNALRTGKIYPTHYFMFLETRPGPSEPIHEEIRVIPAGDYLCFRCCILKPDADTSPILHLLTNDTANRLVLACEYEDSTDDSVRAFENSCFEIQIQL